MYIDIFILPMLVENFEDFGEVRGLLSTARTLRVIRLVRLLREFPDVVLLVSGMKAALRSVGSTLILMIAWTFMMGLVMRVQLGGLPSKDYPWFVEGEEPEDIFNA